MARYALHRIAGGIPIIFVIVLTIFILLRLVPGSPINALLPDEATPQQIRELTARYGLDDPIMVQFGRYLIAAAQLDFGTSIRYNVPVSTLISQRLPVTFELAVAASIIALVIGMPLGILSARRHGTWLDRVATGAGLFGISAPSFWIGLMLVLYLGGRLGWFPTGGQLPSSVVDPGPTGFVAFDMIVHGNIAGLGTTLHYLFLPALTMGAAMAGLLVRMTRSSLLEVIREDYVRTARAKGANEWIVTVRHALRNALLPVVTVFGLELAGVLAGSIIVENVFAWPGLGNLLLTAVSARDYPVVQGCVLVFGVIFVVVNLLVDLSYRLLDPRIKGRNGGIA
ncbi:MAG: ABC transporter permease [Actinoallomurus sp.]